MPNTTPDTTAYLFLGLGAILVITSLFIASMITRYHNLQKDMEQIREIEKS